MYTMLIAEDEDNIREAFVSSIDWESIGFEIIGEAQNGIEALELIEKFEPDILVSDIKMPFINGIDLVRQAREISPSMQNVFLSGYDHFEYAKEAIRFNILEYLLKPLSPEDIRTEFTNIKLKMDKKYSEILNIDDQIDAMRELQTLRKQVLFEKLFLGYISEYQLECDYKKIQTSISIIPYADKKLCVFIVKAIDSIQDEAESLNQKRLYNITKIITEKYLPCECIQMKDSITVIVEDSVEQLNKYIRILSKDIVMSAKRVIGIDTYFGQSNYFDALCTAKSAYSEARESVMYIYKTDLHIIHKKDLPTENAIIDVQYDLEQIELLLKQGNYQEIEETVEGVFSKLIKGNASKSRMHGVIFEILFLIFKVLRSFDSKYDLSELEIESFFIDKTFEEIKQEIMKLAKQVTDNISVITNFEVNNLSQRAVKILEEEFSNAEMSLVLLSERLYCSPNYLSSMLTKHTGNSFVEILTSIRMEKAKELVETTQKKVMQIAEECGYKDQHYFSYCFKKCYSVSPLKMREN